MSYDKEGTVKQYEKLNVFNNWCKSNDYTYGAEKAPILHHEQKLIPSGQWFSM